MNPLILPKPVRVLKNTTVRFDEQMRKELERVADLGGVSPADVVRLCVQRALPIVEEGYRQMNAFLEEKLPTKGKK